jgi:hypothetical protein
MPRIIGRLTSIGLAKEASRGTSVTPAYWIPVRGLTFDDNQTMQDNESGFGTIDAIQDSAMLQRWSEGDFAGKVYDQSEGLVLSGVFGQAPVSTQRASTGTYDHVFSMLNSNQHRSLTATIKEGNNDLRYANAVIDSYVLEATLDDYIHRTLGLKAKTGAAASDTIAYTNENEFLPKHVIAKLFAPAASVGAHDTAATGAAAVKVRSFSINIQKNTDPVFVLGSNDVDDVLNKQLAISGTIELYYDSLTYRNLWSAVTHQGMRLDIVNTDVTIGGSNNPAIRFDLYEVVFTNWSRSYANNDVMTQTLEFRAILNVAAAATIGARLTNQYIGTNYV